MQYIEITLRHVRDYIAAHERKDDLAEVDALLAMALCELKRQRKDDPSAIRDPR